MVFAMDNFLQIYSKQKSQKNEEDYQYWTIKKFFDGIKDLPAREVENGGGRSSLQTLLQVHDIAAIEHHVAFSQINKYYYINYNLNR